MYISGAGSTLMAIVNSEKTDFAQQMRVGCDEMGLNQWQIHELDVYKRQILKESVLAEACSRKGQVNSGGNTKRFALVLEKGRELFVV